MARVRSLVLGLFWLLSCDSKPPPSIPKAPPPPPFPGLTARPAPPEPPAAAHPTPAEPAETGGTTRPAPQRAAKESRSDGRAPDKQKPAPGSKAYMPPAAPTPAPSARTPEPPILATTPKPEVASRVTIPKTVHVQVSIPAGLQADLDRDPRMQPWVNQVIATIDRCYTSQAESGFAPSGTIEVSVTMHANDRPDADIKQLPPTLTPLVGCATSGLMRAKMPLFTGQENARYAVRLRFSP